MEKEEKCSYCNGAKFIDSGYTEKEVNGKRVLYPYAVPCYCEISRQINKKFDVFSRFSVVPPEDAVRAHELYEGKNVIFYGTELYFLYLAKAFFTKGFLSKDYLILEGSSVVDKYNVPQENGTRRTIVTLNQYDHLVLLFTSCNEYPTLKTCISDVIKNRYRINKSTWVYAYDKEHLIRSKEYSSDLDTYLNQYITKELNASNFKFKGFNSNNLERKNIQSARSTQDRAGNF